MTRQVENFNACERPQSTTTDNLCKDIYTPQNKDQFCGNKKPEIKCNSDDDFNSHLSDNLSQNIYDGGCDKPDNNKYQKNIDKGQKYLDKASTDLDQALSALDNGNTRGAMKQIEEALKRSGKSVDQFGRAVDRHDGGGANGGYGEDAIKDGSKEIKGSREEMKDALELLKCGKTGEAYEAIRAAKDGLKSGGQEVQVGEDTLKGNTPVNTARGREAASDKEFKEGAKEFDKTGDALEDALNSLDHGDKSGALRDLERSQRNLGEGQNNYKDGLRLNQTGDESGIKKGLETSKTVDQSIEVAMDLLKSGCAREAKQVIEEAMKRLEKSSDQLAQGVEKQDQNDCDFRPGDRNNDPRNDDRNCDRGRDIDFPRDYRSSNPDWRDRLNPMDRDRITLFPGEFGIGDIFDRTSDNRGTNWQEYDQDRRDRQGGFNPLDPAGLFSGNFNPLDPAGLFDNNRDGGFNPLDPAGLFSNNDGGFNPLDPAGLFNNNKDGGFNPLDPAGLFANNDGGFNPLDPAGLFNNNKDGGFNPLDPAGLFNSNDGGGFNPLDPAGLFASNDKGKDSPLDILNPIKVTKKIFGGLFG
ncbi:MAG: hypothetical protein C0469_18495 [Cyanobacteria bacterium DS2.3.42]|nr:hypothetical protein [Cyanobacteria bacterium DS2.3.42]